MGVIEGRGHRLIGRSHEWAAARHALGEGAAGIVFAGSAGVGKTALARALAAEISRSGAAEVVALVGSATDPSISFGAFAPLVPDLGGKPGRPPDPLYLLQNFRSAVLRRAKGRPLVLVVDDAHSLDPNSATLVLQLVAFDGVKVVMAMESHAPAPSALRSLWKDGLVERVEVGPLDREATVELVTCLLHEAAEHLEAMGAMGAVGSVGSLGRRESLAPYPVGGEVADAVWRLSEGNPLYTRELLAAGRRSGSICFRDGVWRLNGSLGAGSGLQELVDERLSSLTEVQRAALEIVAVGGPIPLRVLLRVVDNEPLEALQLSGLVTFEWSQGEQSARTAHPILTDVVHGSISVPRRAAIGRRLADEFEAAGCLGSDLLRVMTWRLDGGADVRPEEFVRAALLAAERQDWRLSARLATAAFDLEPSLEARLALVDAHRALGRFRDGLAVLGREQGTGDDEIAKCAVLRGILLYFGLGDLDGALTTLADSAKTVGNGSDQAWLEAVAAGLRAFAGRPADAVELASEIIRRPDLSTRAEATAKAVLSMGLSWTGRTEQALELLDGTPSMSGNASSLSAWAAMARGLAYKLAGRVESMQRLSQARYDVAVQYHDEIGQGTSAAALGWVALEQACLPRAVAWFREATATLDPVHSAALRVEATLGLAEALALAGQVDAARQALDEVRPVADRSDFVMQDWCIAAAWLAAAQGALTEALGMVHHAAEAARRTEQVASEIRALHAAVRLGSAAPAARLATLAQTVEGPLIRVVAAHATALAEPDFAGPTLDAVAESYADLGLHLYGAEAAAQACRAHQAAGHSRRAAASAARGHILLGSSDEGPPPVGLALALTPPELTRREREVALLAARGLASQAIATRLCLSVRTVETHLARVYTKLGIGSRSELAVALVSAASRAHQVEAG
ncbi:MAG TPA: LuxR C-terminal-related transcriptional regulator [Acidimicrobiales bacterium]|nr:LuxR C-terminal-related transcriptional regulator [Acidimicrobiales bacterium]